MEWDAAFARLAYAVALHALRLNLHRMVAGVSAPLLPLRAIANLTDACSGTTTALLSASASAPLSLYLASV